MKTGYFANVTHTKVHIVRGNDKPVCGSRIGDNMEFQWCSMGIYMPYVECEHCKKWYYKRGKER